MSIWLAFEDEELREHHMRWHGHETLESAREELNAIINMIAQGGQSFPNTYIYEGDKPLYGNPEEEFDLAGFENLFKDLNKVKD